MVTVSGRYSLTPPNGSTSMAISVVSPSDLRSTRPLTLTMRVLDEQVAVLLVGRRPGATLDAAVDVLEAEASHTPPFLLTFFCALATMPPVHSMLPSTASSSAPTGTSISSRSCSRRSCSGCEET